MISPVMPVYARANIAFERGQGAYIYTADGRRFLDFGSGVAVNALGHAHPRLVAALTEQAEKLWHCSNLYQIPAQENLARRLVENSFADSMFFVNSGAEAIECGIKMIRRYHDKTGNPDRYRVITFQGGFHGRTLAAIAAGGRAKHLDGFAPAVDGFDQVAFGHVDALRAAVTSETAAILIEPILGEGGIRPAETDFLKELRAVADEFGLLVFFDEVQAGMGRTGRLFAHEWSGVTPDVMAVAKGLGGGFPVGACMAVERVAEHMTVGTHGATFGGNPLAMAVAGALVDEVLREGFLPQVERIAGILWKGLDDLLAAHEGVFAEIRGRGLMIGLRCVGRSDVMVAALREEGLITISASDNVIRLLPPLIIDESHVAEALAILDRVAGSLSEKGGGA